MNFKQIVLIFLFCFSESYASNINITMFGSENISFRDIQNLKNLFMDAFHAVYIKDWDEKIEQQTKDIFESYLCQFQTNAQMILFVAEKDAQIAGWALFKKVDDENAILEILCISPHYWRQGIGKKLAFAICDQYQTITHISLMTRKINPISPHFYEALGFKQTDFYLPEYKEYENLQGFEWRKLES